MKHIYLMIACWITFLPASSQTPEQLKSWLPQIDGWTLSDKVEVFTPDNLFDRINGSAPLFLENNFREMTAMEYTNGDDYITIQAYRHGSPEDTFGMYASERSPEMNFFPFGAEAQGDDTNIYFFAGNMYVKMWANGTGEMGDVMKKIADDFAKNIEPNPAYPVLIQKLPQEGKQPRSETYITSNYIGHNFLNGVYTANYELNGQSFQAFIIDAKTVEDARKMLSAYFDFTKQPQDFEQGKLIINDRYNGNIPVFWNGQYIIGVFSESGKDIDGANEFLETSLKALNT